MQKRTKRPFGLNAIILLQMLTVLITGALLAVTVSIFYMASTSTLPDGITLNDMGFYDLIMLVFTFVVNLLCVVGLWLRRRWAWYLTMLQVGVFMLEDLHSYFNGAPGEDYVWSMLLNVSMVFYLNQRDVQAVFQHKAQGDRQYSDTTVRSLAPSEDSLL